MNFMANFRETGIFHQIQGTLKIINSVQHFTGGGSIWTLNTEQSRKLHFGCFFCQTSTMCIDKNQINEHGHYNGSIEIFESHEITCEQWKKARSTLKYLVLLRQYVHEQQYDPLCLKSNIGFIIDKHLFILNHYMKPGTRTTSNDHNLYPIIFFCNTRSCRPNKVYIIKTNGQICQIVSKMSLTSKILNKFVFTFDLHGNNSVPSLSESNCSSAYTRGSKYVHVFTNGTIDLVQDLGKYISILNWQTFNLYNYRENMVLPIVIDSSKYEECDFESDEEEEENAVSMAVEYGAFDILTDRQNIVAYSATILGNMLDKSFTRNASAYPQNIPYLERYETIKNTIDKICEEKFRMLNERAQSEDNQELINELKTASKLISTIQSNDDCCMMCSAIGTKRKISLEIGLNASVNASICKLCYNTINQYNIAKNFENEIKKLAKENVVLIPRDQQDSIQNMVEYVKKKLDYFTAVRYALKQMGISKLQHFFCCDFLYRHTTKSR